MKVAIIGLGDIAQKAYLPVLSEKEGIELILCTRNRATLAKLASKYRIAKTTQSVEELLTMGVNAAIVSTATEAHFTIAEQLIQHGVHTYIDKPISLSFEETQRITTLAEEHGVTVMVGFNRRFIPRVRELKGKGKPSLILMQKNRFQAADYTRRFVVEDFIHVVDTLRFLMDTPVTDIKVDFQEKDGLLHQLVVNLIGEGTIAIGIMNRHGGVTEETIEYHTGPDKYVVNSLVETTHYHNKKTSVLKFGDWEPTLYKRGFYQLLDHFIDCVKEQSTPDPSLTESLTTHELCEQIVKIIER